VRLNVKFTVKIVEQRFRSQHGQRENPWNHQCLHLAGVATRVGSNPAGSDITIVQACAHDWHQAFMALLAALAEWLRRRPANEFFAFL
jgi:hypothetical protein